MAKKKQQKARRKNTTDQNEATGNKEQGRVRDPYTGEQKPLIPNSGKFVEVVPHETDDRKGQRYLLNEETSMDALAADENAEEVSNLGDSYTEDADVEEDFGERQGLASGGRK